MENNMNPEVATAVSAEGTQAIGRLSSVSNLLSSAGDIYKKNILKFLGIMLLPLVPLLGAALLFGLVSAIFHGMALIVTIFGIIFVLAMVYIFIWMAAALIMAVSDASNGSEIMVVGSYEKSQRKIFTLLAAAILNLLAVLGGFVLLIIPAFIFGTWFGKASYVVVNEEATAVGALSKSRQYVKQKFWPVFGRACAIVLISLLIELVFAIFIAFSHNLTTAAVFRAIYNIVMLLWVPFVSIYNFTIYSELKKIYEAKQK